MTTDRPNNRTNYHSHCSFCDGKAPMEDFVEEAVRQGFAAYGISSHAPLPFPARWTLEAERMAAYLAEIDRLKAAYADRIELYAGLEIDYLNEQSNPASDYFQKLPLDYRIGSVHLIESRGKYVDIDTDAETFAENLRLHFGDDLRKLVTDYFDKLMRMVSTGGFDFVGHADKIVYNASRCQPDIAEQPWYRQKIREYFETIARHGAMVETTRKIPCRRRRRIFPEQIALPAAAGVAHSRARQFGRPPAPNDRQRPPGSARCTARSRHRYGHATDGRTLAADEDRSRRLLIPRSDRKRAFLRRFITLPL